MAAALFSKILTKNDVENYLIIASSTSLGQKLPYEEGQTVNMYVRDDDCGQQWIFPCTIRLDEAFGRHFLSVNWAEFARQKDVRVGDQVFVYEEIVKHQSVIEGSWMKIEVQRKIRMFGVDIWANVQ